MPESEDDVVALSETWLSDNVSSSELFPKEYNVDRKDRKFNLINRIKGCGVLLAVKVISN